MSTTQRISSGLMLYSPVRKDLAGIPCRLQFSVVSLPNPASSFPQLTLALYWIELNVLQTQHIWSTTNKERYNYNKGKIQETRKSNMKLTSTE